MGTRIRADLEACQGYANCVVGADDYFDLDDDGLVVILREEATPDDLKRVSEAVRSCPVSALTLHED